MQTLKITFSTGFYLNFTIHNTNIAQCWVKALQDAQSFPYPIDDPKRFYGFNDQIGEQLRAVERINTTIKTINDHEQLINRTITDVHEQDTLNYLHHIFEVYHGLLDQQDHPYFLRAPTNVRQALGDLNLDVHRCETSHRSADPRCVLTWYGLPKNRFYKQTDLELITNRYNFGGVYLNYTEIGKTLTDYYLDNDNYIAPEGFRPIKHFSADITIKFADIDHNEADAVRTASWNYFDKHKAFFNDLGYFKNDPRLEAGLVPVASINSDLSQEEILLNIKESQHITSVELT